MKSVSSQGQRYVNEAKDLNVQIGRGSNVWNVE
jgi:hypothetical protein